MSRVAAGDSVSFRSLYDLTGAKLYLTVRRILHSEAAAEDAVQEAYLRVWRRAGDFDPGIASPIAWMTTIARHAAIDMIRRGAQRVSDDSIGDSDEVEKIADTTTSGERLVAASRLKDCLHALDGEQRNMVLLAYCHGFSRAELAARFGRPVATVKTILRRCLIALKDCLGDER
jgi:RNA polymerase sigma-70 factor (ECF subfamily)